jgi:hypothetical protein
VKERLEGRYLLEPRGLIEVKGKGPTPAWYLLARSAASGDSAGRSAVGTLARDEQPSAGSAPG